jgi:hypothetical protein
MEVARYNAALTTTLADSSLAYLNEFVYHAKNYMSVDSLPEAFDFIYILKNETEEAALKNLVKRTDFDATSTATFTQLQGIAGNGSSTYINTTFTPSTDASAFTLNSATMGIYSNTDGVLAAGDMGSRNGTSTYRTVIFCRFTNDVFIGNLNTSSTTSASNDDGTGFYIANRNASDATPIYLTGYKLVTSTGLSTDLSDNDIIIGGINTNNFGTGTTYSSRQYSFAFVGKGMTDVQARQFTLAVQWLLDKL